MIRAEQFKEFVSIANELLLVFNEGSRLYQAYPLLRRWQEILNAIPLDQRKLQPWIVLDMPPGLSKSYALHTTHPTKFDESFAIEWMPNNLGLDDERKIIDHLVYMLDAWLRVELTNSKKGETQQKKTRRRRPQTNEIKTLTERQTEAVMFVGECEGNIAKAARRAGIDRKSMKERYDAAMKKLGKAGLKKHKTQQHLQDRRGQENITQDDDRRG